jgi:hypothetical protein
MGMIACAGACVSLSALANTTNGWFGVSVNDTTVNAGTCAVTTNNVAVTSTETAGKIVLDNDIESALTIAPDAGTAALSDGLVTITATAVITPSDKNDLELVAGAQAGFAVAVDNNVTNFYGYASAGGTGGAPGWIQFTTGPADPEAATTFTIAINYRDKKVSFYNGTTLLTNGTSSEFSISNEFVNLSNVAAYGSGSISSVTSKYEVAVAAYGDKKYGSGAEAVKAKGSGTGDIKDINSNGEAAESPLAENGLYAWQCDILGIEKNAKVPFKPAATINGNITLQVASEIEDGIAASFTVYTKDGESWTEGETYPSNAIQLPIGTSGKYQIKPVSFTAQ